MIARVILVSASNATPAHGCCAMLELAKSGAGCTGAIPTVHRASLRTVGTIGRSRNDALAGSYQTPFREISDERAESHLNRNAGRDRGNLQTTPRQCGGSRGRAAALRERHDALIDGLTVDPMGAPASCAVYSRKIAGRSFRRRPR